MTPNRTLRVVAVLAMVTGPGTARGDAPWLVPVQGYLTDDGGAPIDGTRSMGVALYTAPVGGSPIWAETQSVTVDTGYFTVYVGAIAALDLATFRDQGDLWLGLTVGSDPEMTPRLDLGSVPYAGFAQYCADAGTVAWTGITGVPGDLADGDADTTYSEGTGILLTGTTFSADTTYLQRRVTGSCPPESSIASIADDGSVTCEADTDTDTTYSQGTGIIISGTTVSADTTYLQRRVTGSCVSGSIAAISAGGGVSCHADDPGPPGWELGGNNGTTAGVDYLGTNDGEPLQLHVAGARALRIEPGSSSPNLIGGAQDNVAFTGLSGATIGGGGSATGPNQVTDDYVTVGGGLWNRAGDNDGDSTSAAYATVGGGGQNVASGSSATVAGGYWCSASGLQSVVGGGASNHATAFDATIAGGELNTASGNQATVGGGISNMASGTASTVPGGAQNLAAGQFSFAAGLRAKANNPGCFVWGDATPQDVACATDNRWIARSSGGVYFYTDSGMASGAYLAAGSGTWASLSDRDAKRDIVPVDGGEVLARLVALPVATWRYRSETTGALHMGPIAQDFHAAFRLGDSERHITTVDADGVALAAIQGLNAKLEAENRALRQEIASMRDGYDARLAALEHRDGGGTHVAATTWPRWIFLGGLGVAALVLVLVLARQRRGGRRLQLTAHAAGPYDHRDRRTVVNHGLCANLRRGS